MVSFEELVTKFEMKNMPPYGMVIVVPGNEFNPDWEDQLCSQGCRVHFTDLNRKPVTIVQKGKGIEATPMASPGADAKTDGAMPLTPFSDAEFPWSDEDEKKLLRRMNESEGTVYERAAVLMPEFPGRSAVALRQKFYKLTCLKGSSKRKGRLKPELLRVPWNAKDDALLIELWKKRLTVSAIAQKIPGRSYESVKIRLEALKKLGRIEPRWKQNTKKTTRSTPESKPPSTPEHESAAAPSSQKLEPTEPTKKLVSFEAYCRKCRDRRSVHDETNVWKLCPVCGEPLIVWNIEFDEVR